MFITPRRLIPAFLLLGLMFSGSPSVAEERGIDLTIRNHRFEPTTLNVPANTRLKLIVRNMDPTPEEFESYELNREKVIPGHSAATIYIGPLNPGSYPFFGEFHQNTAKGRIVAK